MGICRKNRTKLQWLFQDLSDGDGLESKWRHKLKIYLWHINYCTTEIEIATYAGHSCWILTFSACSSPVVILERHDVIDVYATPTLWPCHSPQIVSSSRFLHSPIFFTPPYSSLHILHSPIFLYTPEFFHTRLDPPLIVLEHVGHQVLFVEGLVV